MPFIECHIAAGLSEGRKRQLIREIVRATHEAIDSDPKIINVLINEHPGPNMCISGRVEADEATERDDAS
jgi:4-oxalocrotonate tautomerase family enzyme